jgi:hypothetical protein
MSCVEGESGVFFGCNGARDHHHHMPSLAFTAHSSVAASALSTRTEDTHQPSSFGCIAYKWDERVGQAASLPLPLPKVEFLDSQGASLTDTQVSHPQQHANHAAVGSQCDWWRCHRCSHLPRSGEGQLPLLSLTATGSTATQSARTAKSVHSARRISPHRNSTATAASPVAWAPGARTA